MSIEQLIDHFYEQVVSYQKGKHQKMVLGQIAWVPTLFVDSNMTIIKAERSGREDHHNARLKFQRLNSSHFKSENEDRIPIPNIRLSPYEELLVFKAKRRPCIFFVVNRHLLRSIVSTTDKNDRQQMSQQ